MRRRVEDNIRHSHNYYYDTVLNLESDCYNNTLYIVIVIGCTNIFLSSRTGMANKKACVSSLKFFS